MSEHEESPRNSVQAEQEKLLTVSHPGPSAWWFLGGGTIGYLAGKGAVMIEISDGEKSYNLARRYLVSVPEPDFVALKLRELRA